MQLTSKNYELLIALLSRINSDERPAFFSGILCRVGMDTSFSRAQYAGHPAWDFFISELPLVVEFCVRNGAKAQAIQAIAEAPATPATLLLVNQLEDMTCFNFTLFSEDELESWPLKLERLSQRAAKEARIHANLVYTEWPSRPEWYVNVGWMGREIVEAIERWKEECRRAGFLYLKSSLEQAMNLEINQDMTRVEEHLNSMGFSAPLALALHEAERIYRASATQFELKSCLGHLRSALEGLHRQTAAKLAAKAKDPEPPTWGKSTEYLVKNNILSKQEETFAAAIFTLISDAGVHPLIAEREYARLLRNVVVEYGLLFLSKLKKFGITL